MEDRTESCCPDCLTPSRRQVLAVAAATVALPMAQAALNGMAAATAAPRGGAPAPAPVEKAGWFDTKIKPADVPLNEFKTVEGHAGIVVSHADAGFAALTTKCTHKGCTVKPKAGDKTITCPCHQGQYNLDGSVAKAPPKLPLAHFAIRVSEGGTIEVDPGQTPAKDDKTYIVKV